LAEDQELVADDGEWSANCGAILTESNRKVETGVIPVAPESWS